MKSNKILSLIITFVAVVCLCIGLTACSQRPEPKTYTVNFFVIGGGGKIIGNEVQVVKEGESTEKVIAVADPGYYFTGWYYENKDDQTLFEDELVVENVQSDMYFGISFEKRTILLEGDQKTVVLDYKFADKNTEVETATFTYGHTRDTVLPVPERKDADFGGWYADQLLTVKVADETGRVEIEEDVLYDINDRLYSKWISRNKREYKILMVYVTEVNAELIMKDNVTKFPVHYKMTEMEHKICETLTERFEFALNDLAVADFHLDSYFTTIPLTQDDVRIEPIKDITVNSIRGEKIQEIRNIVDDYESAIVTYSFGDIKRQCQTYASVGGASGGGFQYMSVSFEGRLANFPGGYDKIGDLLDESHDFWESILGIYWGAVCYSVECKMAGMVDIGDVETEYNKTVGTEEWKDRYMLYGAAVPHMVEKLYLLGNAIFNGEKVGVPHEFWENKVAKVHYDVSEGGYVTVKERPVSRPYYNGFNSIGNPYDLIQFVIYGYDALEVEAKAFTGWKFVKWSDGQEDPVRHETNLSADFYVEAIFERIES